MGSLMPKVLVDAWTGDYIEHWRWIEAKKLFLLGIMAFWWKGARFKDQMGLC